MRVCVCARAWILSSNKGKGGREKEEDILLLLHHFLRVVNGLRGATLEAAASSSIL
jgi:hypothetical protein